MVGLLGPSGAGQVHAAQPAGRGLPAQRRQGPRRSPSSCRAADADAARRDARARRVADAPGRGPQPAALLHARTRTSASPRAPPARPARTCPTPTTCSAAVGLAADAHRPLATLTPGHLQLAALAVAMAPRPGLLLADEPTSQLDHRGPRPGAGPDGGRSTASSAPPSSSSPTTPTWRPSCRARSPSATAGSAERAAAARSTPWSRPTASCRCRCTCARTCCPAPWSASTGSTTTRTATTC